VIEPSAVALFTAVMVPLLAGLLYIIRAEIRKNSVVTDATHEQVIPNHGTSLRDAIDRIEKRIDGVHEDVTYLRDRVDRHVDSHDHANPTGRYRRSTDTDI
jgi:hypothetical protein